jgi:hypothetical protein
MRALRGLGLGEGDGADDVGPSTRGGKLSAVVGKAGSLARRSAPRTGDWQSGSTHRAEYIR